MGHIAHFAKSGKEQVLCADIHTMSTKVSSVIKTRALSMFVVVALLSFPLGAAFASDEPVEGPTYTALQGTGTPNDPLIINECAQLNHVNVQQSSS